MTLAASGHHALLACRPLAEHHSRTDLRFIPVHGLEATSQLGLLSRTDHASPQLAALARLLHDANVAAYRLAQTTVARGRQLTTPSSDASPRQSLAHRGRGRHL